MRKIHYITEEGKAACGLNHPKVGSTDPWNRTCKSCLKAMIKQASQIK